MHRDEKEPDVGDLHAQLGVDPPVVGMHDQPTDLGRSVVRVADLQHLMDEVLVDGRAVPLFLAHRIEDVGSVASTQLRDDHRAADRSALLQIAEDEYVAAMAGIGDRTAERVVGEGDDRLHLGSIGRQIHRVEKLRELEEIVLVVVGHRADLVAKVHWPPTLNQNSSRDARRLRDDAVTSEVLGVVERVVGVLEHLTGLDDLHAFGRCDTGGKRAAPGGTLARRDAKADTQTLGENHRTLVAGLGSDDGELLASVAKHLVRRTHAVPQDTGEEHEHVVSHGMSERVVDRFEEVDVEQDQGEVALVAAALVTTARERVIECPTIADVGQRVDVCTAVQRLGQGADPQHGGDADFELDRAYRLGDEIVGTGVERSFSGLVVVSTREKHDGDVRVAPLAQKRCELEPVDLGHDHVEQDEVGICVEHVERFGPVRRDPRHVTHLEQDRRDAVRGELIVVDDENSGAGRGDHTDPFGRGARLP